MTPLFPVDYTRSVARDAVAHISVDESGGNGRPDPCERWRSKRRKETRGRLGHDVPLESVGRVSLQERINRWTGQGVAWLIRKLMARLLRGATPASTHKRAPTGAGSTWNPYNSGAAKPPRSDVTRSAISLHRDPWCGTHVLPEISFPLEQAGQVVHFCSAECRTRYQQSSQRAASA